MTRQTFIVTEDAVRPARPDGTCFYCRVPLFQEHSAGCVLRRKTVIVELTVMLLRSVPEDWNEEEINFNMNESSSCCNNLITELAQQSDRMELCMCDSVEGKFVRDATQDDEDLFGVPNV